MNRLAARVFSLFWVVLLTCQLLTPVLTEEEPQEQDHEDAEETATATVDEVTKETFLEYTKQNKYLLALFYETGCVTCDEAKSTLATLVEPELFPGALKKVQISDFDFAKQYGAVDLPAFVLFREGKSVVFDGEKSSKEDIEVWLDIAYVEATKILTDDTFEHLTQASTGATTGDWLVAFYKDSCSSILPVIESFGVRVRRKMNVAKVSMESNPKLVKRMKTNKCPAVIFYRQGKMYRYEVEKYDTKSLTSFVEGWYKNMKAESVPRELTGFDELTENIAKALKDQIEGPNRSMFFAIFGGIVSLVVLIIIFACAMKKRSAAQKKKLF